MQIGQLTHMSIGHIGYPLNPHRLDLCLACKANTATFKKSFLFDGRLASSLVPLTARAEGLIQHALAAAQGDMIDDG
jgi:hypothetical protein